MNYYGAVIFVLWDAIGTIAEAEMSHNMIQKELAECTGINWADISKIDNGSSNSFAYEITCWRGNGFLD